MLVEHVGKEYTFIKTTIAMETFLNIVFCQFAEWKGYYNTQSFRHIASMVFFMPLRLDTFSVIYFHPLYLNPILSEFGQINLITKAQRRDGHPITHYTLSMGASYSIMLAIS